ncbi:Ger(x)C family spore germination protein [Paenibacillus sp. PAMC21692]|uniref:Ger(x)C family spore germination protein n=1 Tax=Paenibacillus sp. PAMC21692 TaxID=2762320 RepID=UPI0021C3AEC8|nr:Ger(x)C family spore germination protein [Paenibacillus sp. PAMC21692]
MVIGESMAQRGIKPALEFFSRDAEERRSVLLAISQSRAEDIINAKVKTGGMPALSLVNTMKQYKSHSKTVELNLNDYFRMYHSSTAIMFPTVSVVNEQGEDIGYHVAGSAIVNGEQLAGYLTPIQTRGVLWVIGKVKSGIIVARCHGTEGRTPANKLAFEIMKADSKVKVEKSGERFRIKVQIEEEGNLAEASCSEEEINPDRIAQLEAIQKAEIEKEIQSAIMQAKKFKADVFGFGEAIHRADPVSWRSLKENWSEIFPKLGIEIQVETKIVSSALNQRKSK